MKTILPIPSTPPHPHRRSFPRAVLVLIFALLFASIALAATSIVSSPPAHAVKAPRQFNAADIHVADGYRIELFASNLSVPSMAIFDGRDLIVAESGWANTAPPRILRIKPDGLTTVVVSRGLLAPVNGLLLVNRDLYISHRGKVSVLQPDGKLRDILTGLPSGGDNQNNDIVLGPDGRIYMGQGTVTNAGVVGLDSYLLGWLDQNPSAHDIPCHDVPLLGQNYQTNDPLRQTTAPALTGAFEPFGAPSIPDEIAKGNVKCSGSILRFNPDGSGLETFAWGLKNPFGLQFDQKGQLWATSHGVDLRGSRSIANDPDYLVQVQQGAWYGWPDFFDGQPVTAQRFIADAKPQAGYLWDKDPPLSRAYLTFQSGSGAHGLALSPGGAFGSSGNAFVAMFGSYPPLVLGSTDSKGAFRIARVDLAAKTVTDIAQNNAAGPAYENGQRGLDRPSDVVFGPDSSLYVIDWGASQVSADGPKLAPLTGAIWRIYSSQQQAVRPNGPTIIHPPFESVQVDLSAADPPGPWYGTIAMVLGILLGLAAAVIIAGSLAWYWLRLR